MKRCIKKPWSYQHKRTQDFMWKPLQDKTTHYFCLLLQPIYIYLQVPTPKVCKDPLAIGYNLIKALNLNNLQALTWNKINMQALTYSRHQPNWGTNLENVQALTYSRHQPDWGTNLEGGTHLLLQSSVDNFSQYFKLDPQA